MVQKRQLGEISIQAFALIVLLARRLHLQSLRSYSRHCAAGNYSLLCQLPQSQSKNMKNTQLPAE